MFVWTAADEREFVQGYVTCALWASTDTDETPLDDRYVPRDIGADTAERMARDCQEFLRDNTTDLIWYCIAIDARDGTPMEYAGHDFWLTRNHHGAGFWARGAGQAGDNLTAAADSWGEFDLFI